MKTQMTFSMNIETAQLIEKIAKKNEITKSFLIFDAIREYQKKHNPEKTD